MAQPPAMTNSTNLTSPAQPSHPKLEWLQMKYESLLEHRIQALEQQLVTLPAKIEGKQDAQKIEKQEIATLPQEHKTNANNKNVDQEEKKAEAYEECQKRPGVEDPTVSNDAQSISNFIEYRESKLQDNGERKETVVGQTPVDPKPPPNKKPIAVIRYYGANKEWESWVEISNPNLNALILFVLAHNPTLRHYRDKDTCTYLAPYEPFIHSWFELQAVVEHVQHTPERQKHHAEQEKVSAIVEELRKQINATDSTAKPQFSTLEDLRDPEALSKTLRGLKALLDHIEQTSHLSKSLFKPRETPQELISWKELWTIFPPGELLFTRRCMKKPQLLIAQQCSSATYPAEHMKKERWRLYAWTYDWNGEDYSRSTVQIEFDRFKSEQKIDTLECYPLKCASNPKKEMEDLITRGKKFRSFIESLTPPVIEYDGAALLRGEGFHFSSPEQVGFENQAEYGQIERPPSKLIERDHIIIDHKAYRNHGPSEFIDDVLPMDQLDIFEPDQMAHCKCSACDDNPRLMDNQRHSFDKKKNLENSDTLGLALLPPRMLGYWLAQKTWVEVEVDNLPDEKPVLVDKHAMDKLQLNSKKKDLVRRLIQNHAKDGKRTMTDLSKGKGQGLVMLFHGPPGVGKTSTAECIARASGKPLMPVTSSSIGVESGQVERRLSHFFELARSWGAILLFDEADVFLESRANSTADLGRNSLVSVLLRILETYSGILILTTNRIRSMDIAVQSRINLAIRYPDLSVKAKKTIYLNFIRQLTEDNAELHELETWIDENEDASPFEKLNGRQIRNVLFSAVSMATGEKRRVRVSDIEEMLRATEEFVIDLTAITETVRKGNEIGYRAS